MATFNQNLNPYEFFKTLQKQLPKIKEEIIKEVILVESKNFARRNFRDQGFTDTSLTPWKPIAKQKKTPKNKKKKAIDGVAILVETGKLKQQATKPVAVPNGVKFTFTLPYAAVHNYGLKAGRGPGFDMPKRQFIGESQELNKRIKAKCIKFLNNKLPNL